MQIITLLYKKGANIHLMDAQGYNALHLAVHAGHLMMIVYLISIGLDVDGRDTMVYIFIIHNLKLESITIKLVSLPRK